uniref:LORF2 protein n=1 Tax=Anisakis simplex TaxID=6269 RepID=A0A0M3KCU1_ANISI
LRQENVADHNQQQQSDISKHDESNIVGDGSNQMMQQNVNDMNLMVNANIDESEIEMIEEDTVGQIVQGEDGGNKYAMVEVLDGVVENTIHSDSNMNMSDNTNDSMKMDESNMNDGDSGEALYIDGMIDPLPQGIESMAPVDVLNAASRL